MTKTQFEELLKLADESRAAIAELARAKQQVTDAEIELSVAELEQSLSNAELTHLQRLVRQAMNEVDLASAEVELNQHRVKLIQELAESDPAAHGAIWKRTAAPQLSPALEAYQGAAPSDLRARADQTSDALARARTANQMAQRRVQMAQRALTQARAELTRVDALSRIDIAKFLRAIKQSEQKGR